MPDMLSIGDFARATHLNVKTLRYYQKPAYCFRPKSTHILGTAATGSSRYLKRR